MTHPGQPDPNCGTDDALSAGFLGCVALAAVGVFAGAWFFSDIKSAASTLMTGTARSISSPPTPPSGTGVTGSTGVTGASKSKVSGRQLHGATKFLTFYWLNARIRVDYCAAYDVQIRDFQRTFERAQAANYRQALSVYAQGGGESEDRLFQSARLLLTSKIEGDMQAIIKQVGGGPRGACDLVNDKAELIVRHLDFQKDQPELYSAMMGR